MMVEDALYILSDARREALPLPDVRPVRALRDETGLHADRECAQAGTEVFCDLAALQDAGAAKEVCPCLEGVVLTLRTEEALEALAGVVETVQDVRAGRKLLGEGTLYAAWRGAGRLLGAASSLEQPLRRRRALDGELQEEARRLAHELRIELQEALTALRTPEGEAALVELIVGDDVPEQPWTELDGGALWVGRHRVPAWPANLVRPALSAWAREVRSGRGVQAAEEAARERLRECRDLDRDEASDRHLEPALAVARTWFAPGGERRLVALPSVLTVLGFGKMGLVNLAVLQWGVATHTEGKHTKAVLACPPSVARALCGRVAYGSDLGPSDGADRRTLETMLALWEEHDRTETFGTAANAYLAARGVHAPGAERNG